MEDEQKTKLLESLANFEHVKYKHYNFSDPNNPRYARIEIITTPETAEDLENKINLQLSFKNGFRARLMFTSREEQNNGRFRYEVDIAPYDFVLPNQWVDATEDVLARLPKLFKDSAKSHPSKNKKKKRKKAG
ncbi:hypothetical protein CMI37_34075 [Candidatus Pacearchaeota archaeon]|nr:hypothetical protein [Candidatus Pacearchaeota archaeon]|tara:strand:- start:2309 stop:2707 length:399 start_codon:yes stop_codon:yes gene_type:complete